MKIKLYFCRRVYKAMNLGQVYTRRTVADFMTAMFGLEDGSKVLDPCFGHGVFVISLLHNTSYSITGVEIDTESFNAFSNPDQARCKLLNCDFFDITEEFDGIIMKSRYQSMKKKRLSY